MLVTFFGFASEETVDVSIYTLAGAAVAGNPRASGRLGGTDFHSVDVGTLADGIYMLTTIDGSWFFRAANNVDAIASDSLTTTTDDVTDYRIAVTVTDTLATPIAGARVTLLTSAGLPTGSSGYTSVSGQVSLPADDGDWLVRVTPPRGYDIPENTAVTVSGGDEAVAVEAAATFIEPAVAPEQCAVAVDVIDERGEPVKGAKVSASLTESPSMAASALVVGANHSGKTDENGRVVLTLVRSSQFNYGDGEYEITVETRYGRHQFSYTVPDAASAVATAIVEAA